MKKVLLTCQVQANFDTYQNIFFHSEVELFQRHSKWSLHTSRITKKLGTDWKHFKFLDLQMRTNAHIECHFRKKNLHLSEFWQIWSFLT